MVALPGGFSGSRSRPRHPAAVCDGTKPASAGVDEAGSPIPVTLTCEAAVAAARALAGPGVVADRIEFAYGYYCPPGYFCVASGPNEGHVIFRRPAPGPDLVVQVSADPAGRVTAQGPVPVPTPSP